MYRTTYSSENRTASIKVLCCFSRWWIWLSKGELGSAQGQRNISNRTEPQTAFLSAVEALGADNPGKSRFSLPGMKTTIQPIMRKNIWEIQALKNWALKFPKGRLICLVWVKIYLFCAHCHRPYLSHLQGETVKFETLEFTTGQLSVS